MSSSQVVAVEDRARMTRVQVVAAVRVAINPVHSRFKQVRTRLPLVVVVTATQMEAIRLLVRPWCPRAVAVVHRLPVF